MQTLLGQYLTLDSNKKKYITIASSAACVLLYIVEQVLAANYLVKTLAKIVLFGGIPWYYYRSLGRSTSGSSKVTLKSLRIGTLLGADAFGVILATYAVLQGLLDLPAIALELQQKSQITPSNFLLVGLYITFGNSFLEELFFRGFIFRALHGLGQARLAYWYSSLLFGLYHIAIFQTWFSPWLIGLALLGLASIGLIFNWINAQANHLYNSWLAHILADAAIILIGLRMFAI